MVKEKPRRIKWKPYGTIEPGEIPEVADQVLDEFFRITKKLKLRAYLAFGLCLGFVRDKAYIPGDNDLDLVVLTKTGGLTPDVNEALEANGFVRKASYPMPSGNTHFVKNNVLLDIYFRVDGKYYGTLGRVRYKGKIYAIPDDTDAYLTVCYGDWRTKGTISARYR